MPRSFALLFCLLPVSASHDGPDPLWHWLLTKAMLTDTGLQARFGPEAELDGAPVIVTDRLGDTMYFDGRSELRIRAELASLRPKLPERHLTIATWCSVETPQRWGGVWSLVQDNDQAETGVVLGYDEQCFTFALASEGTDDGDGKLTFLRGRTEYQAGRLYHVVATYDGQRMRLYVNGVLDGESSEQSGAILWPQAAPMTIGAFRDRDEDHRHHGRIRDVAVYDLAATEKWITDEFAHGRELAAAGPVQHFPDELTFVVAPYQQWVTKDGVTVMWETSRPASTTLWFGPDHEHLTAHQGEGAALLHRVRVDGLAVRTPYFFRVESVDDRGQRLSGPLLTTRTAVRDDEAWAFVVIGDTQDQPKIASRIAQHAFALRPDFCVIAGDLVGTGPNKAHWTQAFFPSMQPLVERMAFFPVLGNHEQDARHYYDYVDLPAPEYRYTFGYGNSQWFMLDSNREVGPDSAQYRWLEQQLQRSTADWKFVVYHHPSYSSDEDDYGDMWKGPSSHGDLRVRQLVPLYDRYGVDVVWNGHIHSYERTWPLRGDQVVGDGGTTYVVTGGGGGKLETAGPIRPFFQNTVKHGHHFCFVAVHGDRLEFKAYDVDGHLFDVTTIEKRAGRGR